MNSIASPMSGRSVFDGLVEHRLERDERGVERAGHTLRGGPIVIKLRKPFFVHRATTQDEWLADHQLHLRQRLARAVEQRAVIAFVNCHRARVIAAQLVPDVIHADQNADQIRLEIEAVGLPALRQLKHFVAADPAIEHGVVCFRMIHQQLRRREPRVTVAQCGLLICRTGRGLLATGVRDGVALEEDHLPVLEQRTRRERPGVARPRN